MAEFESYDQRVADGLVRAHEKGEGLPGYLGIRLTETWPGGMRAEIPVRDELLNPFGNLHGGVLASLCDHVLGTVCYPVIPPGAWAATTEFKLNYLAPVTAGIAVGGGADRLPDEAHRGRAHRGRQRRTAGVPRPGHRPGDAAEGLSAAQKDRRERRHGRVADPDDRSCVRRAAALARGPSLVLGLGRATGRGRRSRGQPRSHPSGAVISLVRRLAARRSPSRRLRARRASLAQGARRLARDPRRPDRPLRSAGRERARRRRSRQCLRQRRTAST